MKISYNDMFTNISDVAYEILEEKLKTSKPTITGKEVNLYRCPYGEYNNL